MQKLFTIKAAILLMFASAQLAIAAPAAVVAPVAPQTSSLTPEILHKYLAVKYLV